MRTNPEFLRNLWLEFSWHRLLATPVILLLIFYLFGSLGSQSGVLAASVIGFFALTVFWGSQQAAASLLREIQGGTWPSQRLTAIEPWPMTWGKLLGSTAYPWYAGAWCLLVFVLTGRSVADQMQAWGVIGNSLFLTVIYFVVLALLFQTSALLGALIQASRQRLVARRRSLVLVISVLVLGLFLIQLFSRAAGADQLHWWGGDWSGPYFGLLSLTAFVGWALIGATMLMRRELQVANTPWVWLSFLAFISIYFSGFVQPSHLAAFGSPEITALRLGVVLAVILALSYVMVFFERTTIVDLSRLRQRLQARAYLEAFEETPRWALTALAAWLAGVLFMLVVLWLGYDPVAGPGPNLYAVALAALCFLMRDLAVVMAFNFSGKAERSGMAALIYLGVLYLLLPWLFGVLGLGEQVYWLLPTGTAGLFSAVLPALVQAGLAWALLVRRWRISATLQQAPD